MYIYEENYKEKITSYLEHLIEQDGYYLEKYTVTTKDGYINTIYRIPHTLKETSDSKRPAVLLGHGMVCSSAIFVDQCQLAYYLVDNGFDVWLPNNRGTTFSTKHADYDAEEDGDKYWDFSQDEIALYDLTAFIDYVVEKTGEPKIFYIGFSQGVTAFAIMASELQEYNEKIKLCIFFGCPLVFENVSFFPVKFNVYLAVFVFRMIEFFSRKKLCEFPLIKEIRYLLSLAARNTIYHKIFGFLIATLVGYRDNEQLQELDYQRLSITTPNTISVRQITHYAQMMKNKSLTKYDYGETENMRKYGKKVPPKYDMQKITAPVAIFYGKNDMYNCWEKDHLERVLGNVVYEHVVEYERYNHLDFLFAKDNIELVYKHALELMKEYNEQYNFL